MIINKFAELLKEQTWSVFTSTARFLESKTGALSSEELDYLIEKGLAYRRENNEGLTPIGKIIFMYKDLLLQNRKKIILTLNQKSPDH